jgi:hypothetical protein
MSKTARNASARARASEDATDVTTSPFGISLAWLRAAWVLAAGALTMIVLALASFNSADPQTSSVATPNNPPLNLCGKFGAVVAYRLYEIFGVGVWLPVSYLATVLAFVATGRPMSHPFVRFIGACVMMVAIGGLHHEWMPAIGPVAGYGAGLIPMSLSHLLHEHFGIGASLLFMMMLAVGAIDVRVLGPDGRPLEGALLLLSPKLRPERVWPPFTSDADGAVRIRDLPPERYILTVRAGEAEVSEVHQRDSSSGLRGASLRSVSAEGRGAGALASGCRVRAGRLRRTKQLA